MARHLLEKGHEVTMICGSYGMADSGLERAKKGVREGFVDGIRVIEFNLPYSNSDSFLKRSTTFLKFSLRGISRGLLENYDLLFATSTPLTAGIPGIIMKPFRNKPFIFEVRDLWPELPEAMGVITNPMVLKLMAGLEWSSYHAADHCIGLSPGIRDGIRRKGISPDRVSMIPNGCDLDFFQPTEEKDLSFIEGIEVGDTVAIFTGAHGYANGLHAALDAAKELNKRGERSIKLLFVGDGVLKPELIRQAEQNGLDNCVFHDPIPKTELKNWLSRADIGMMLLANVPAFYYGTSPNKFFDYIAAGLPVLNNYPGWLADMINEYDAGIAVPPDRPSLFSDALVNLHSHKQNRISKGLNARKLAESKFDRNNLAAQFEETLQSTYEGYHS